jgi:ribonuclease VapC
VFVDSSVFVAILSDEEDANTLLDRIEAAPSSVTSGLVILESAMRLTSKLKADPLVVLDRIEEFMGKANMNIMPIEAEHGRLAAQAFSQFGKGRGHPAQLNLADCLSYACAKSRSVPLLYKGRDFAATDLG